MKGIPCKKHDEAYIQMLPVCECGYVFTDLSCSQKPVTCKCGEKALSLPNTEFNRKFCPQCGKRITSVLCPELKEADGNLKFYI